MPGRGKVELPLASFCSGYSVICSGRSVEGRRPGSSWAPPQCPSPRRIVRAGSPGAPLPARGSPEGGLGGRCAAPEPRPARGKVRAEPFHADAGGLCQQSRAYLPPPWLFAFGEAPAAGGWEGLRDAALEPWKGLQEAICSSSWPCGRRRGPGWGRRAEGPKATGAQRRLSLELTPPGCLGCAQARAAGPPPPTGVRGTPGAAVGAPLLLRPPLGCQRFERGSRGPRYCSGFIEEAEREETSHCPTFHPLGNSTPWVAPASLRGPGLHWERSWVRGILTPGRGERDSPHPTPGGGVCSYSETFFSSVSQTMPPSG